MSTTIPCNKEKIPWADMVLVGGLLLGLMLRVPGALFQAEVIPIRPVLIYFPVLLVVLMRLRQAQIVREVLKPLLYQRVFLVLVSAYLLFVGSQFIGGLVHDTLILDKHTFKFLITICFVLLGYLAGYLLTPGMDNFFLILLVLLAGSLLIDWSFGISASTAWGRPSATFGSPNDMALAGVGAMTGALRLHTGLLTRRNFFVFALALFCVFISRSAGGCITYCLILFASAFIWIASRPSTPRATENQITCILVIFVLSLYFCNAIWPLKNGGTVSDLFQSTLWDNTGKGRTVDEMAQSPRWEGMEASFRLIQQSPVSGYGPGVAYRMEIGPHNMWLRAWVEGGISGFLAFSLILGCLFFLAIKVKNSRLQGFVVFICGYSLTVHNLTEDKTLMIILGLLVAQACFSGYKKETGRPESLQPERNFA